MTTPADFPIENFSLAELGEMLGARFELAEGGAVLLVHFPGSDERWQEAPAGYPQDGTLELINFRGRVYCPPTDPKTAS